MIGVPFSFVVDGKVVTEEFVGYKASSDLIIQEVQWTPEQLFHFLKSSITEDIVKKINATFLFVIEGKHPGKLFFVDVTFVVYSYT